MGPSLIKLGILRPDDLQDLHEVVFSDPAVTWDGSGRSPMNAA